MNRNKIFGISLAILFSAFLNAQGTLQFDRVIFEEFNQQLTNIGGTEKIVSSQFIINPGQVGKLIKCNFSHHNGGLGYPYIGSSLDVWIELNNTTIFNQDGASVGFPIWLDEGTYDISLHNHYNSAADYVFYAQYSVIIFNVVP